MLRLKFTTLTAVAAFLCLFASPAAKANYEYSSASTCEQVYQMAAAGDIAGLRAAKSRGVNLDATNDYGDTPLCVAIYKNDLISYRTLAQAGADTDPDCLSNIPSGQRDRFLNAYYRRYSVAAPSNWKKYALIGLGAAALIGGGVAIAASGHHGSKKDSSPTPEKCEANKCAEGCYTNITCATWQTCDANNECGGCTHCSQRDACLIDQCGTGCYEDKACESGQQCTARNECGGCTECAVVTHPIANCLTYDGNNKCTLCVKEYMPNADGSECVRDPIDCSAYTETKCDPHGYCETCTNSVSKTYYKLTSCNEGYEIDTAGTACVLANTVAPASITARTPMSMGTASYAERIDNAEIAAYLDENAATQTQPRLFAYLDGKTDKASFTKAAYQTLGLSLLPNFAEENMAVTRSLNTLVTNNLFADTAKEKRMMVGYDYLAFSRHNRGHITGYDNYANSAYFIGDTAIGQKSRFGLGMSISRLSSDYKDDSKRDETFVRALASYMYDLGADWHYAGFMALGYGDGDYKRHTDLNTYKGDLRDILYGVNNQLRYEYATPWFVLEPQLELNINGYHQRHIDEENKEAALKINAVDNLSAESGVGLYVAKELTSPEYGKLKGRVGGSYYREWARPYHTMTARLQNSTGSYHIRSQELFDRDRVQLSADVIYSYLAFDIYVRASQYWEKHHMTILNAGLKYNF